MITGGSGVLAVVLLAARHLMLATFFVVALGFHRARVAAFATAGFRGFNGSGSCVGERRDREREKRKDRKCRNDSLFHFNSPDLGKRLCKELPGRQFACGAT